MLQDLLLPNNAGVPLPVDLPANVIPTLAHIADAEDYLACLKGSAISGLPQQATRLDLAAAFRYKTAVALASTAPVVAPAWLQQTLDFLQQEMINNTNALRQKMNNNVAALRQEMDNSTALFRQEFVQLRGQVVGLTEQIDRLQGDLDELSEQMEQLDENINEHAGS